jgi:hypothetical protein
MAPCFFMGLYPGGSEPLYKVDCLHGLALVKESKAAPIARD